MQGVGGQYIENSKVLIVTPDARDIELAGRFWSACESLLKYNAASRGPE